MRGATPGGGRGVTQADAPRTARAVVGLARGLLGRFLGALSAATGLDLAVEPGRLRPGGERPEPGGSAAPESPDDPAELAARASRLRREGDLDAAEPLLRRALAARSTTLGDRHVETASLVHELAELRFLQGDLDGAEPLFSRALQARLEARGESHPETADTLSHLGLLRRARGDLVGAEAVFRRAFEARRSALGERHPQTILSALDLGSVAGEVRPAPEAPPSPDPPAPPVAPEAPPASPPPHTPAPAAVSPNEPSRPAGAGHEALGVLDRVLGLSHKDRPDDAALAACQAGASALRGAIAAAAAGAATLPPEAERLAAGTHPLAALLRLAENRDASNDNQWASDYVVVKTSFGASLAQAATRSRLVRRP